MSNKLKPLTKAQQIVLAAKNVRRAHPVAAVETKPSDISLTLQERGTRYGDFKEHAILAQQLQDVMRGHTNTAGLNGWAQLSPTQKQALTVIADKMARMLNGDPTYYDNPHDIEGYARLMSKELA